MNHTHSNTIEEVRKSGRHLSWEERGMIQALHRQGLSLRGIAAALGCAHTTVLKSGPLSLTAAQKSATGKWIRWSDSVQAASQ